MTHDLDELKELVAAIKADHQAQKEKEKRDAWIRYVSLSMIFIAVLAAIATGRGGGYSSTTMKQLNEATFNQAEASDQWAYYQAKGIKQSIAEEERDRLQTAGADAKVLAAADTRIGRYDTEKKDITKVAKSFEAKRDESRAIASHAAECGREMGTATTLFQIAIAVGGITLIMKKRWLWTVSLIGAVLATVQMIKVIWFM